MNPKVDEELNERIETLEIMISQNNQILDHIEEFLHDFTMDTEVKKTVTLALMTQMRQIEEQNNEYDSELQNILKTIN